MFQDGFIIDRGTNNTNNVASGLYFCTVDIYRVVVPAGYFVEAGLMYDAVTEKESALHILFTFDQLVGFVETIQAQVKRERCSDSPIALDPPQNGPEAQETPNE